MSTDASFATGYIACRLCFAVVSRVLATVPQRWGRPSPSRVCDAPIVAGEISGLYAGEDADAMEGEFLPMLAEGGICHDVIVTVMSETGVASVLRVGPAGAVARIDVDFAVPLAMV